MARIARSHITALHDTVMAGLSFVLALYLRLGERMFTQTGDYLWEGTFAFAAIAAIVFLRAGVYRGVWRYASLPDLYALARAATWTVLLFLPVIFLVFRAEAYPRSALIINWFTLMALTGGVLLRMAFKTGEASVQKSSHSLSSCAMVTSLCCSLNSFSNSVGCLLRRFFRSAAILSMLRSISGSRRIM